MIYNGFIFFAECSFYLNSTLIKARCGLEMWRQLYLRCEYFWQRAGSWVRNNCSLCSASFWSHLLQAGGGGLSPGGGLCGGGRGRSGLNQILQTLLWSPVGLSPPPLSGCLDTEPGKGISDVMYPEICQSDSPLLCPEKEPKGQRGEGAASECCKRENGCCQRYSVECVGAGEGLPRPRPSPASLQWVPAVLRVPSPVPVPTEDLPTRSTRMMGPQM